MIHILDRQFMQLQNFPFIVLFESPMLITVGLLSEESLLKNHEIPDSIIESIIYR